MRRLLMLLVVPALAVGQGIVVTAPSAGLEKSDYFYRVVDTAGTTPRLGAVIYNRAFTGSTVDTSQILETTRTKSVWIHAASKDSTSLLISYRLSLDTKVWTAFRLLDSLKMTNQTGVVVKSLNVSAQADSARYIQFQFSHSAKAYAMGTTSATYTVTYAIKRD